MHFGTRISCAIARYSSIQKWNGSKYYREIYNIRLYVKDFMRNEVVEKF